MNKLWTIEKRVFRAYTLLYITRRACPALAIKNFNRFPLCYYYIESIRFCQVFQESFTFPNMTDCTNAKRMVHSERPGHSRQPSRQVFSPSSLYSRARKLTIGAYIPPAKSWRLLHQQKKEGYTYIYNVYCPRRSIPNQFSPETGERATKQEYDKPHDRVVIGRNTKHPAACKCA